MIARALSRISEWYSIPLMLLLWQLSVSSGLVESRLLPSLVQVWTALASDIGDGTLLHHAGTTFSRAAAAFMLAGAVGVPFAMAMARSVTIRNLFEPIFFFGYPIPKIALFPVFTYVFGIGSPSKIAFAFLECLYPIVVTAYLGFRSIPNRFFWTAQNMGAPAATILYRVMLPSALPSVFAGLRVALPISIIVVVLTEMIGDSRGLGYYIAVSGTRFEFQNVYAAMIVVGICGFLLDRVLLWLRRRLVHWERDDAS
jgi:ABC-type nitrate/sulfonate/bicarbonate transport system permease component